MKGEMWGGGEMEDGGGPGGRNWGSLTGRSYREHFGGGVERTYFFLGRNWNWMFARVMM